MLTLWRNLRISVCGVMAAVAWLAAPAVLLAQDYSLQTGSPSFSTNEPIESGLIDLANGDLQIRINVASFPQRGSVPFTGSLIYDSRIWKPVQGTSLTWQPTNVPNSQGGWRYVNTNTTGSTAWSSTVVAKGRPPVDCYIQFSGFNWTDASGTKRFFTGMTKEPLDPLCGLDFPNGGGMATDASGFRISIANYTDATIYAPDGTQVYPTVSDVNGNFFSNSGANVVDTLGRTPVTITTNCGGNSAQTCYDILNSKGTTSRITVLTTSIAVSTQFGVTGITEYSGNLTVVQKITLPDLTFYQFGYDGYGELSSMTLPAGGQITYGYSNFHDALGGTNRWVSSRMSGGGTWSYTPAVITTCASGQVGCQQKVTVTKPSADNCVYIFTMNNGAWMSQRQDYTGSILAANLVSTTVKIWDFSQACSPTPCTGASNIRTLRLTSTLPVPGGASISNKTEMTYADLNDMNVSAVKEWRFYAGTSPTFPATPDRETDLTYHALMGKNILNRVLTSTVKDGGGTIVAQTTFSYDDTGSLSNSTPATGIAHHDDTNFGLSNTARGNPTSIQKCLNLGSCSTNPATTTLTYDTTGQVLSARDQNGNTTNFNYADNFYQDSNTIVNPPATFTPPAPTNAYLKTITPPTNNAITFGYYYGTGKLASTTDSNGANSFSHFIDSLDRRTHSYGPSLAGNRPWVLNVYNPSDVQIDSYTGITDTTPSASCTFCRWDETILDNLGRPATHGLMNDPEGPTSTNTTYDTSGRVQTESHPFRSFSDTTYGLEWPTYDGLNRVTKITHPDGTFSQTLFGAAVNVTGARTSQSCSSATYGLGYPTLSIDENGKKREVWADGFGRTIEGDEPDSTGSLASGVVVCYLYNALGSLTQNVSGSQTRTYTFDALSRVTSVKTPEVSDSSGVQCSVGYTYDANGNILTRTAPIPNQSACTSQVTTTYTYDVVNRLKRISYSSTTPVATPTVQYGYDGVALTGCTTAPPALTDPNPKGRRTSMCDGSGATSWSHDAAGRTTAEARTISGITKNISYAYNLDGSIKTVTYPSSKTITYTVSNAQRLTTAKDIVSGTQFALAASYAAPGGLQSAITGQVSGGFGGVTETHSYNSSLEYTSTKAISSAGTSLDLALQYLPVGGTDNGSVTKITNNADNGRTVNFGYDSLNRISSASSQATSGADCWGQNFGPDTLANLNSIALSQCSGTQLSVTVNSNTNHINTSGYTYDALGNTTQAGLSTPTYSFDAENRLVKAAGVTGGPYCYLYDGNGLRVAKKSGANSDCSGGTIVTLYWRSLYADTLAISDATGSTTNSSYVEYVLFSGRRIASRVGTGQIYYFFADQVGTVRTRTTGNGPGQTPGQLCYDADFTPYGQEMQHTERLQTTACPPAYRFAGYEFDSETGLYYAFARYYSPLLGRFLSTDPIGGSVGNLQSLNAYAYVLNNPANFTDPSGAVCSGNMGQNRDTPCNPANSGGGGGSGYGFFGGGWSLFNFLDLFGVGEGTYSAFMKGAWATFLMSSPYFNGAAAGNPCSASYTIGMPIQTQWEMAKANGDGIAIGSISFSQAGPVNGFTLNFFKNYSQGGATVYGFTTVSFSYGGPDTGLSIGASRPISLPTGTVFASATADLIQFSGGKVTDVSGSVNVLGLPVDLWSANNPQLGLSTVSSSQLLTEQMNASKELLSGLNSVVDALGDCRKKKK
jgi:RHS repeat-associated protein